VSCSKCGSRKCGGKCGAKVSKCASGKCGGARKCSKC
jgi:hypothetical protein